MQQTKKQLNIRNKKVAINSFLSRVASTCSSVDSDFLVVNKRREYMRKWKKNNPDKVKKYSKQEWLRDKEKLTKRHKEYRLNNPEKVKTQSKKYLIKNREKIMSVQKQWRDKNRIKVRQYAKDFCKRNPEKIDRKNFRTKAYFLRQVDLSYEQFNEMLKKQKYLCAICGLPETIKHQVGTKSLLSIDHCHKTNKVRGLLCRKCNSALGFLQDDPELLLKAYNYLIKNI